MEEIIFKMADKQAEKLCSDELVDFITVIAPDELHYEENKEY